MGLAVQRSFEDLGTALVEVTFCVFDLETTGGSAERARITEIGAVKVRGGEVLGEFQTLVNPHTPIPPAITMLTGITDEMVADMPGIEGVLPMFLEFVGDATLVAHNSSFDTRFLAAGCARLGYRTPPNPVVCTIRLARRLVRDEVPNLQLATLARALRSRTVPSHRALDDARATTDVFHALLELAGRWGVTHLDDLLWFQSARGHPQYRKTRLCEALPRARGVYLFRDAGGRVIYVGKATDLRARVRSYFSGDDRRRIDDLLREMDAIEHIVCATDLDASVLEARLIRLHAPPHNRAQRGRRARWFIRLTEERFPRLARTKSSAGLGPLSAGAAAAVREALEEVSAIRTCTARLGPRASGPMCVRGQIGRCGAPCEAHIAPEVYAREVEPVARALAGDATEAIGALARKIERLASAARFEEAASARDRLGALVEAVRQALRVRALTDAGRAVLRTGDATLELGDGFLVAVDGHALPVEPDGHPDEPRVIAAWLARRAREVRVVECENGLALPFAGGGVLAAWAERLRRLRLVEARA